MIFITGGTGFIGAHFLKALINKYPNEKIVSTYLNAHMRHALPDYISNNIQWVNLDLLDADGVYRYMKGASSVYHLAAIVSFSPKDYHKMLSDNSIITANVVNAAISHKVNKFLHLSSIAALGTAKPNKQITESTDWTNSDKNSYYARSKYAAEMEVWRGIAEGLNAIILNPSVVIGPSITRNWNRSSCNLFTQIWKGLSTYPTGKTGIVSIDDVVNIALLLMEKNLFNERYIVNATDITYQNLFTQIAIALGKKPPSKKITPLIGEVAWRLDALQSKFRGNSPTITQEVIRTGKSAFTYDSSKIVKELNYTFQPTAITIQKTAKAFLNDINAKS